MLKNPNIILSSAGSLLRIRACFASAGEFATLPLVKNRGDNVVRAGVDKTDAISDAWRNQAETTSRVAIARPAQGTPPRLVNLDRVSRIEHAATAGQSKPTPWGTRRKKLIYYFVARTKSVTGWFIASVGWCINLPLARKVEKQTENDQHISDAVASLERLRNYRVSWGKRKKKLPTLSNF